MPRRRDRAQPNELPPGARQRECLRCRGVFLSLGAGNRLCQKCQRINADLSRRDQSSQAPIGLDETEFWRDLRSGELPETPEEEE